jgi:hypothetical protein
MQEGIFPRRSMVQDLYEDRKSAIGVRPTLFTGVICKQ